MSLTHWLEDHFLACPVKVQTGLDCPGCGLQRSFVALLRGELLESFVLFPALLPFLAMLLFLGLHLKFKFTNGATVLMGLFVLNASLVLGNYLLKLFTVLL